MSQVNKPESLLENTQNSSQYQKRGYMQDLKISMVKEEIGKYLKRKTQGNNGNTSKPASC